MYYGRSGFGRKKQKDFYRKALSGRRDRGRDLLTLSGADFLVISVIGAGAAHCISEMIMLRTETENQKFFSSGSRATMISAGSMAYSIFMTVLSPGGGALAEMFSVSGAFTLLGLLTAATGVIMFAE